MIIELQLYHPQDGRQYESPVGGEISAVDRIRIDCAECSYTKVKVAGDSVFSHSFTKYFNQVPEVLDHCSVEGLQWYEAILVQYRCGQEAKQRCLVGIGYTLMLYGAEPRPTRLEAMLGPAATSCAATKSAARLALTTPTEEDPDE